jgi:hypothetical protein
MRVNLFARPSYEPPMTGLLHDVDSACAPWPRSPGFALIAVAVLASSPW